MASSGRSSVHHLCRFLKSKALLLNEIASDQVVANRVGEIIIYFDLRSRAARAGRAIPQL